jgi:DNA-directed RNA polymerase subunit N (RpoN/RPB10)
MIIPIRCFTCNKLIADKYQYYLEKKEEIDKEENESDKIITTNLIDSGEVKKTKYGELLDELGLNRYCCRRMMLSHVDIINVI